MIINSEGFGVVLTASLTILFFSSGIDGRTLVPQHFPPSTNVHENSSDESSAQKLMYTDVHYTEENQELNCSNYILEKEYLLLENGSLMLPGSSNIYSNQSYILYNDTVYLCADNEETTQVASAFVYDFSKEFLSCGKVLIHPHEYDMFQNGSVYIKIYSKVSGPRDYYMNEKGVYICIPPYEEMLANRSGNFSRHMNKFSVSFSYVTCTGLMLSILSLLAHLAVFCVVSSVRNLPGCCLASLSLSLLMAYLCFLTLTVFEPSQHCASLGMCVYYFFLTSFFWMNAIAFDVWRSFRVVMRELRISSNRVPWKRFLLYSIYSWCVPALLTAMVKVGDSTNILPEDYRPSFGKPICWFGHRKALLVFFAVPLCAVMLLNAIFFLDVTYVISRATLKTSQSHEATLKKRFFMFMRLALIMGLTWIVGLVAGYADNDVMWYLFVILNTLQGVFIFVVFSCSSKVRGLCCKQYKKMSQKRGSTSVRTISQISAAV